LAWSVEFQAQALEDMRRLDKPIQRQILRYLRERIEDAEYPRRFGKALTGNKVGLWRYRVGDYRVICSIEDNGCWSWSSMPATENRCTKIRPLPPTTDRLPRRRPPLPRLEVIPSVRENYSPKG
jgi:mRNA interferase RelE/StbE